MPENQQWLLKSRPTGALSADNFQWRTAPLPEVGDNQALIRNIYLSLDPAMRGWVSERGSYLPPVEIGAVMRGATLGVVESSRAPGLDAGDIVQTNLGWQAYGVAAPRHLQKMPLPPGVPLTAQMAIFNHIGLTAYVGLLDIGRPREGETLVVSGAAGAVGSLVGQLGKIHGCRVVGIAGSAAKCAYLTDELGFDGAINYKTETVRARLRDLCPNGVDIYFENVGGRILDDVLTRLNVGARIPLCGLIAQYNATEPVPGPTNFPLLLTRRVTLQGFIVTDHRDRAPQAMADLLRWYQAGQLQYRVEIVRGLENAPTALNRLFDGNKQGKLLVQIGNEPAS